MQTIRATVNRWKLPYVLGFCVVVLAVDVTELLALAS